MSKSSNLLAALQAAALIGAAALVGAAGEDVAVATIPAFHDLFGTQAGQQLRPVHTKGTLVRGVFRPAAGASALTQAEQFSGPPVAVLVRLSNFFGRPDSPDAASTSAPRGMAIKFTLANSIDTDVVAHSYNGFPAATPDDFLAFLRVLAVDGAGASDGEGPLGSFLASHPRARQFLEAPQPPPVSWANETFYGVNALCFRNGAGLVRFGRYQIVPLAGDGRLSSDEAAQARPDYLARDLTARLAHGPVGWRLLVQLASEGDDVTNGSVPWPSDRPLVDLGTLQLQEMVSDSVLAERELMFSPLNLVRGIESSEDPMLAARSRAYGASFRSRVP